MNNPIIWDNEHTEYGIRVVVEARERGYAVIVIDTDCDLAVADPVYYQSEDDAFAYAELCLQ